MHLGTLFLEGPQGLVPSTSGIISSALTAGAVAPAVKPPAPAVNPKLWHCGGQVGDVLVSVEIVFFTLAD